MVAGMDEEELQRIYQWIDEIPLSRPKRNIARDFADGVLVAEVVAHYYPRMVELHNYPPANSFAQKLYNWQTLNKKVFKKISLSLFKPELEALCNAEAGAIEQLLKKLQAHLAKYNLRKKEQADGGQQRSPQGGDVEEYDDEVISPPYNGNARRAETEHQMPSAYAGQQAHAGSQPAQGSSTQAALAQGANPLMLLQERDQTIAELCETVEILEIKVKKLEQLVRLKDSKIQAFGARLQQYEGGNGA